LTVDEMTLSAQCENGGTQTNFFIYATSTVSADLNYGFISTLNQGSLGPHAGGVGLDPGNRTELFENFAESAWNSRIEGQFVYHNSSRVISVTFHAIVNNYTGRCQVTGTALPAPN
jgi:hypothetical protein